MTSQRAVPAVFLALGLLASATGRADFLAYAVGEGSSPLPESIAAIDPRHLVELHWTYRGGRSPVSVLPVIDATRTSSGSARTGASGDGVPVAAMHGALMATLRQTGRFDVSTASSDVAPESALSDGHTLQVSVTRYESSVTKQVSSPRAVRSHRPQVQQGRVALRIRLLGPAEELVVADRFETVVDEPRPDFAGQLTDAGASPEVWQTAVGQATLAAINKSVYEIVKSVGPLPVTGLVVKVEDNRLWVNLGEDVVSVGDELAVTTTGEQLVDPETGLDLGGVETTLATLRVLQVAERFSIAEMVSAPGAPSRGDRVRPTSAPRDFEFAPAWNPSGG